MTDALAEALAFLEPEIPVDQDSILAAALQAVVPSGNDPLAAIAAQLRGDIEPVKPVPLYWEAEAPPEASPGVVKRVTQVDIRPCPTHGCGGTVHMSESVTGWRCPMCRTSYPALPNS